MTDTELFVATAEEKDRIVADHIRLARLQVNRDEYTPADPIAGTPDVHLALTPCGSEVPAISFDPDGTPHPGTQLCCLFKLGFAPGSDINATTRIIIPVLYPNGLPVRVQVYNIYEHKVPDRLYFRVDRSKYGLWLAENPAPGLEGTTTTSTSSTTTTPDPSKSPSCKGYCKWTGNPTTKIWTKTYDGCSNTTTTSTSTTSTTTTTGSPGTSTTSTTTTTTACPCPQPVPGEITTTSTTTTTTTTTTTAAPTCACQYPQYCPMYANECTSTFCSNGVVFPPVFCPGPTSTTTTGAGTTTTCNCNDFTTTTGSPGTSTTTTSPPPPPGCSGCSFFCHPTQGWILTGSDCSGPDCAACVGPSAASCVGGTGGCNVAFSPCEKPQPQTTPPPPNPYCSGSCRYIWIGSQWEYDATSVGCSCLGDCPCYCVPPSTDGSGQCAIEITACTYFQPPPPDGTTTTTSAPPIIPCSVSCTSTTTPAPTTTTPPPCSTCKLYWDNTAMAWFLLSGCAGNCVCLVPSIPGHGGCTGLETVMSICVSATTTTTAAPTTTVTGTTTTIAPCSARQCNCVYHTSTGLWNCSGCVDSMGGAGDGTCDCDPVCFLPANPIDGQMAAVDCHYFGDSPPLCPDPCCDAGHVGSTLTATFSGYSSGTLECGPAFEGDSTPTTISLSFNSGTGQYDGTFIPAGDCADDTGTSTTSYTLHFFCQGGVWKLSITGPCGATYLGSPSRTSDCTAFSVSFPNVIYAKCPSGDCLNGCNVDIVISKP